MATPETTLISRAEVTSITTSATGRKALTLDGSTIELGDTGWRDLTGLYTAGKVTSGRVLVRRMGNVVTWNLQSLNLAGPVASTHDFINSSTLAGFMPEYLSAGVLMQSDSELARLVVGTNTLSVHYGIEAVNYIGGLSYVTYKAWPTTLPGVADGQPVGI